MIAFFRIIFNVDLGCISACFVGAIFGINLIIIFGGLVVVC